MSWQAVQAVMDRSRSTGAARMVLMVIATHADKETLTTFIGEDTLAQEANMPKRTLQFNIAKLKESGELETRGGKGRGVVNTYTLTLPEKGATHCALSEQENTQPIAAFEEEKRRNISQEKAQDSAQKAQDLTENTQPIAHIPIEPEIQPEEPNSLVVPATPEATSGTEKISKSRTAQAVESFNYWKLIHSKNGQTIFDAKRKRAVEARLKDGYTLDFIKQAIRGIKLDPYCSGDNSQHKVYDDLELICRDSAHLEKYAALDVSTARKSVAAQPRAAPCSTCLDKGFLMVYDFETDSDVKKPCPVCGQKAKAS